MKKTEKENRNTAVKNLAARLGKMTDEIHNFVVGMMKEANVTFISFITSGNNSAFDIDIPHAVIECDGEPTYCRVEGVYCDIKSEFPAIAVVASVGDGGILDSLEKGTLAYAPGEEADGIIKCLGAAGNTHWAGQLFDTSAAMTEIMFAVKEVLDMLPDNTLGDGETFCITD